MRNLIDPRLRMSLDDFWPSICTIQALVFKASASNQQVPAGTRAVLGLSNLPCRLGPYIDTRLTDTEQRERGVLTVMVRRTLKLNGYFPIIQTYPIQQALVDGQIYQIWGIESDSQQFSTKLLLVQIKP